MASGVLRLLVSTCLLHLLTSPWNIAAVRLDVSTMPRSVERGIGLSATTVCYVRNMARATQYLTWVFLDADTVEDQLVSSEAAVQASYRYRGFSVSMVDVGVRSVRYRLSISNLHKEDDGTYRCQVMDKFTHTIVQYSTVSVSVLYFPDQPSCVPSGEFFVMAHSLVRMSCTSASGNPTVNMKITRQVSGVTTLPVVPPPTVIGKRPANWTYYENDDTIVRDLSVDISSRYTGSTFPCSISAPAPLIGTRTSSCVIGPIIVVPVARTSKISVTVEPHVLRVAAGSQAEFTCLVAVFPHVDMAWVQKTWSTSPLIDPDRLVKRDLNYMDSVGIRAVDMDDDGMVVTCKTVVRGITRQASSRLRVIPATIPPPTKAPRVPATTTLATETPRATTPNLISISLVTKNDVTESLWTNITLTSTDRSHIHTTSNVTYADKTIVPTLPAVLSKPWYSKPTGIALIVLVVMFVVVVIVGITYIKWFSHKRIRRRMSQTCRNLRYQNVWSTRQASQRRQASKRQQVTVSSTHIYHEARLLPEKSKVDSTADLLSEQPLVVYAETVVNSLYEAEDDKSKTMPCRKSGAPKSSRQKYVNVISGLTDANRHVTLPNNFMIYGDINPENANPYESLIGT